MLGKIDRPTPRRMSAGWLVLWLALAISTASMLPSLAGDAGETARRPPAKLLAVPTFHSVGLYWRAASGAQDRIASVRYRPRGTWIWREGHNLWFDERVHARMPERSREYRGSLVGLEPGTEYEIEVKLNPGDERAFTTTKTWSEWFPVGQTRWLPPSSARTLEITESGSPNGYLLYTSLPRQEATIDVTGSSPYNIIVDASYVIIRGVTLRNAGRHAVLLRPGARHVVIEDNDISGWGRIAQDGFGVDEDSAISNDERDGNGRVEMPQMKALVIQNNRIHHPRSSANPWTKHRQVYGSPHPAGPQGITLWHTGGNHVIRYNDIYSDDAHAFNDAIGGGENFGEHGSPGPNSDIYGNRISGCWDDGIESEGGNANVRIWGNLIERCYIMIGASPTQLGPLYIFRNVVKKGRYSPEHNFNTAIFLKGQSRMQHGKRWGGGRVYVYHNTLFRAGPGEGTHSGISGVGTTLAGYVSRNNILDNTHAPVDSSDDDPTSDFDCDLYRGSSQIHERHQRRGIAAEPRYDPSGDAGPFALKVGSPGHDNGCIVPGFNDSFAGRGPDRGAQERGAPPLEFGRRIAGDQRKPTPRTRASSR